MTLSVNFHRVALLASHQLRIRSNLYSDR